MTQRFYVGPKPVFFPALLEALLGVGFCRFPKAFPGFPRAFSGFPTAFSR
jgi:hypothetical protein